MAKAVEIRASREVTTAARSLDRFFEHYAGPNQFELHQAVTWHVGVAERGLSRRHRARSGLIDEATLDARGAALLAGTTRLRPVLMRARSRFHVGSPEDNRARGPLPSHVQPP